LEAAFGKPTPCMEPERPTSEYLARCVLELNLWRRDDWITAHRQNPAAVPSTYWVRRLFGSHDNLKWLCERMSFSKTLDKYQSLGRRLGRTPTSAECIAHGIDLKAAYKIFEGKRDIDKLLNQLHDKS
jgi:hypothetical protein